MFGERRKRRIGPLCCEEEQVVVETNVNTGCACGEVMLNAWCVVKWRVLVRRS